MNEVRASLARMMPDAFPIFFDGRNPYEGQREVMPALVRGLDVLFAAPTASGKTEAAIAPLFQRHLSFRRDKLSSIYVAPTKALVNDLYERLAGYLGSRFPGAVTRYTGDRHDFRSPSGGFCLLATPEALDSLQLRRPDALASVRAIVVDEIHLLHGQPRGQQLRHVIDRLRVAAASPRSDRDRFQIVGMTATLDDMQSVARRWLGDAAKVVSSGKAREIDLELLACNPLIDKSHEQARVLADWLVHSGHEKILVFCNSRNGAHALAAYLHRQLEGCRWPVHLHFGALAASQREHVEEAMRTNRFGVCVATSTLEIGIDIGDVDAVVLADAPSTVSAFLQRIGRGNRRSNRCRVIAFRASDEDERMMRALVDCGARGELDDTFEYHRPSVEFQQALSLCWRATRQDRTLTLEKLCAEAGADLRQTVAGMLEVGVLQNVRGALLPCDRLLDEADAGRVHSVISGRAGGAVVDLRTGETALQDVDERTAGGAMFVAGHVRQLGVGSDGGAYLGDAAAPKQRLAKIRGSGRGIATGRAVVRGLAREMDEDPDRWRWSQDKLVTWGGEAFNKLLAALFEREMPGSSFGATAFDVTGPVADLPLTLDWVRDVAAAGEKVNSLPLKWAQRFTAPSKYLGELTNDLAAEEHRRSIPWAPFRRWLETVEEIESG